MAHGVCPRQDSNLRFRLRRPALYPLSYGGMWGRPAAALARMVAIRPSGGSTHSRDGRTLLQPSVRLNREGGKRCIHPRVRSREGFGASRSYR